MRPLLLTLTLLAAALASAVAADAQLPSGIARPSNEAGLTRRQLGEQLYAGNCASCHGVAGAGVTAPGPAGAGEVKEQGPSLKKAGALAADLYLRTGYMPLENATDQPYRRRVLFTNRELAALVSYVASLGNGPSIPHPNPASGSVSKGLRLFTQHCAGCHQAVAEGGYVTNARVPPLKEATARQIAEAVRAGPYLMPKFSRRAISDRQLNSIIAYVEAAKHPDDPGGWGIGHIGPVPEGMVTWLIAAAVLVGLCALIGERRRA
jgi:ubiquinol-cytochrome c reductase cytochrome c subunit